MWSVGIEGGEGLTCRGEGKETKLESDGSGGYMRSACCEVTPSLERDGPHVIEAPKIN